MVNQKENQDLKRIAKHVEVLNSEVGILQMDVKWLKRISWYMAGILSLAVGKVVIFGG